MEEQQNEVDAPEATPAAQAPLTTTDKQDHDGVMVFLSYFGIFALIPYLTVKDDDFIAWHAKQGLTLVGALFATWIAFFILGFIPIINIVAGLAGLLLAPASLVLWIVCLVKAFGGERWRIPIVADLAEKW